MDPNHKIKTPLIKYKFLLPFLSVLSLLIILGAYFYYKHEKKLLYRDKSDDLEAIAKLKINELVSWKKERIGDVEVISQMPFILDFIENTYNETDTLKFNRIFHDILTLYDYEALLISSENGDLLHGVGYELTLFDSLTKEKILDCIEKNSISVTGFYYCHLEQKIHYDIIAPVRNSNDKPVAAIVFRIDPDDFLYPYIQTWPTPSKTSETLLLKEENDSVIFLNELRHMKNTAFSLKIPLSATEVPAVQAIMGYTGILQGIDYRGARVVAYVGPVPGTDWYMVSKIDQKELLHDLRFKSGAIIISAILILLFSGTGVAWLYNSRQKNIYKSLLQAQEEFRTTLYSIGDAVITTDKRGKIKQLNKVAEQLTGWREAEVKGQSVERVFNIINGETRSKVEGPFRKIMDKGKIVGLANHTILVTKQGNDIPISDSGAPIKNDKNDIIGTVLVFRDQTKERRAQKLISKRLSLLEYSSEHTLEEVLRKTIDDICGLTNSSTGFYHILGPDRKTLHLQVWSSKTTMEHGKEKEPDRPAEFTSEWAECIRQEKPVLTKDYSTLVPGKNIRKKHTGFVNELVIPVSKSGKIVAIAGIRNKSDDYDEHDTEIIAYLAGIAWEIAERKKAKESLEEERRLLNSLISAIPDHIYFKDKDCRFIRINNAMSDRLELNDPDEAIGKTDANFFGKEHATQTHKDEKTIIKTGKPLVNIEEKEDWEDGTITWASTTKIPLRDKNGKITGIMGISRDITDRKKMEEELISAKNKAEQSDMLKSAFLANMSHEIRTPLNGILGFTDILVKNNDLTQEEKNHYSSIIAKSAEGLLQVIDDILDLSLIEAGDMQIEVSSFNAEKTLNELSTLYSEKIDELNRNIKLELSIEKNVVIQSDENRLRQIFINLLDNAIKFTEKGEIKFGAERIGPDEIIFFVSDTGIGIPEEMHELIFDRFRQIDVSSTRGHSGNGLGLSIVKKLVELMKGKIWVESDGRKGTVFRFSLPYAKQETVPDDDSSKKTQEIIPVELPVVLLVEDDPVSRLFIEEILKRKCRKLVSASNGKEALTKSRSEKFDVILMDIRLPDINGLDLVRKIRNFDQKVYIIAQSAYAMHADAEKAKSAGCNDYISKPIDTDLLLEKLAGIHNN